MARVAALALLLTLRASAQPGADPAAPFRDARLTGAARDAAGVSFPLGSGTYTLASGTLWEVAAADGTPAGFFFEGTGALAWRVDDAEAAHVFEGNADRLGGFDHAKGGLFTVPFVRASFWLAPELRPAPGALAPRLAPEAAFAAHRRRFARDQTTPEAVGLAAARLLGLPFADALLEGKRDLRHEVDAVFSGEERLAVVSKMEAAPVGFVDWRLSRTVGSRPVGRSFRDTPPITARLTELDVDVRQGDDAWGALAVEETLVPDRTLAALPLNLASEQVGHRALSSRAMKGLVVTDAAGRALPFAFEKDALLVVLAAPAPAGIPLRLRFAYEAPFFEPPIGSDAWELHTEQGWYPAPRAFRAASAFSYHATVRAKRPLVPFTSGDTVRRAVEGPFNLLETRLAGPVAMVGVLAGPYTVVEDVRDGTLRRVASYALPKPKATARLFALIDLFRGFFAARLGPCPWKEITVAETTNASAGHATPGTILASSEAFLLRRERTRDGHLLVEGSDEHVAHELAHAWFGTRTWGASEKDQWMEEAFATFFSQAALEALGDRSEARRRVNVWEVHAREARKEGSIRFADAMTDKASLRPSHDAGKDRYGIVYFKGALLLSAMRRALGDERLAAAVRAFLEERPGAQTTDGFVAFVSSRTGTDFRPLFERTFDGREMP